MNLSMIPLLMHSPDLPAEVRHALSAAQAADPEQRDDHLVVAARLMHDQLAVDCNDARELVGLLPGGC